MAAGAVSVLLAIVHVRSLRPCELPPEQSAEGLRKVRETLSMVGNSEFGRSPRGMALTAAASELLAQGRVRFSPDIQGEALYRKETLRRPVLYIAAPSMKGRVFWPSQAELAERVYHESLHVVVGSRKRSIEEECDAFCAAEEASAVVGQRAPLYPVMRDGTAVWKWVKEAYPTHRADPTYRPVGCTVEEFAGRVGMER